jgi:hypothetical protein
MTGVALTFEFGAGEGFDPSDAKWVMLVGADGLPVAGEVEIDASAEGGGCIVAQPTEAASVAISLPMTTAVGRFRLQTTLLVPRRRPYSLLYELARERIRFFLAKGEDWGVWNPGVPPDAVIAFEEGRDALGRASTEVDSAARASLAMQSLSGALDASRMAAAEHARRSLQRKHSRKAAPSTSLGIRVASSLSPGLLEKSPFDRLGLVSVPLRWAEVQPAPDRFDWRRLDRWMVAADRAKRRVLCGPLVDLSLQNIPDWMLARRADPEALREALYAFCEQVVMRYRGGVHMWNVASGLASQGDDAGNVERAVGLTRLASVLVRQRHPRARILVEIADPFGERMWSRPERLGPYRYLRRIAEEGIHFDVVGLRFLIGESVSIDRDPATVAALLDRYSTPERHLIVSALGAPSSGGHWTREGQASWMTDMVPIVLGRPRFDAVLWGHVADPGPDHPLGLFDGDGRAKPASTRLRELSERLSAPSPDLAFDPAAMRPGSAGA